MTDKEFKRLNRSQLIEIIYHLQLKQDELIAENERLSKELEDKRLRIARAGNIAEASLAIHNVMQDAQHAAEHYLNEIRAMHAEVDEDCRKLRKQAEEEAAAIITRAFEEAAVIQAQGRKKSAAAKSHTQKKEAPKPQKKAEAAETKLQQPAAPVKQEITPQQAAPVKQPVKAAAPAADVSLEEILAEFGSMSDV